MSSLVLLQPHESHAKGSIISKPFVEAKELIKKGVAEFLTTVKAREAKAQEAPAPEAGINWAQEAEAVKKDREALAAELDAIEAEKIKMAEERAAIEAEKKALEEAKNKKK